MAERSSSGNDFNRTSVQNIIAMHWPVPMNPFAGYLQAMRSTWISGIVMIL